MDSNLSWNKIDNYGVCRFCGQYRQFDNSDLSQDERDEQTTRECSCKDGKEYNSDCLFREKIQKEREEQLERAKDLIEELLGEGATGYGFIPTSDEHKELLYNLPVMVLDNKIKSSSTEITGNVKVKISKTAKGKISIARSDTASYKLEV